MKSITIFIACLLTSFAGFSQTKKDILNEIENFQIQKVYNKPFDVEKPKLFEAMNSVAAAEMQKLIRESESRGYVEYYSESTYSRETLTLEITSSEKPYRISISLKKETRTMDFYKNQLSDWKTSNGIKENYAFKLQLSIYKYLLGEVELSDSLQKKIEAFNETQTKEKKKIINGIDY